MARELMAYTQHKHPMTAIDINRYLLQEAEALVHKADLHEIITLREGNAEALPFTDNSFDVTLSLTVMEEGDADRMLAELVRVTRPGGRVAAVVCGEDCPAFYTLSLPHDIYAKAARAVAAGATPAGCADASLYQRFDHVGLHDVRKFPQVAIYTDSHSVMAQYYQSRILSVLTPEEATVWNQAVSDAEAQGTFTMAIPHHCAVGTKR
jgi:SAM-dependent methyltransferase